MKLARIVTSLGLPICLALAGCGPNGSDNDGGGENASEEARALGLMIAVILGAVSEEEERRIMDEIRELERNNPSLHGTCGTKPSEGQYDIRAGFAMSMVPTDKLDLSSPWLTSCGQVGDAFVFCPPGGAPAWGDYVTLAGFSLGGDANLSEPDKRTQIGFTFKTDGGTPWTPLAEFQCDSWGGMTNFFFTNAITMLDGIPSGTIDYGMPDGLGGITIGPGEGTIVVQNGEVLAVINEKMSDPPRVRVRYNWDRGPIGNFMLADWCGGDVEPAPNARTDDSFPILTF